MDNSLGEVVRAQSRNFTVRGDDGEIDCLVPKRLRFANPGFVDPVGVGDRVTYSREGEQGVIEGVEPRTNALTRPASGRSGKLQILAANLDLAVVVLAAAEPAWKPATIDRYLVLASLSDVPAAVAINKVDLDPAVTGHPDLDPYRALGLPLFFLSADTGEGVEQLAAGLEGKTAVLIGPSGAGKSSLLNRLAPGAELRVGEVSDRTSKGRHTTTWVEMLDLPTGGRLIDSPGIRVLDLSRIAPRELAAHFPEIRRVEGACRFQDCRHLAEPGCAVKAAVEAGEMAASRYLAYERIFASLTAGEG